MNDFCYAYDLQLIFARFFWQVVLPFGLEKEVNSHLRAHLSKKAVNKENLHNLYPASNVGHSQLIDGGLEEQEKPSTISVVVERILLQRSLQMGNKQQDWQVSMIQICASF